MASRGNRLALAVAATDGSAVDSMVMVQSGAEYRMLSSARASSGILSDSVTVTKTVEERVAGYVSQICETVEGLLPAVSTELCHVNLRLAAVCERRT